jgi:hypothetical protein
MGHFRVRLEPLTLPAIAVRAERDGGSPAPAKPGESGGGTE